VLHTPPSALARYRIVVRTADKLEAGTDAHVFIVLMGTLGSSEEWPLSKLTQVKRSGSVHFHKNKFERGQTDEFEFDCVNLGELLKVTPPPPTTTTTTPHTHHHTTHTHTHIDMGIAIFISPSLTAHHHDHHHHHRHPHSVATNILLLPHLFYYASITPMPRCVISSLSCLMMTIFHQFD
jgi:hypothetical protein